MFVAKKKRVIAMLLIGTLALPSTACGNGKNIESEKKDSTTSTNDTLTETVDGKNGANTNKLDDDDSDGSNLSTDEIDAGDSDTACSNTNFSDLITEYDIKNAVDDNYRNYYEIFPGYYCDSDGDGMGDLDGITMKLDYISLLGCNGIWLTPIMQAPSYHKYDTSDYYKVDPALGTNDDFVELANECHEKGIKLVIDLVVNHSSSEHPWFTSACDYLRELSADATPDSEECPYVEYYNFSREQINSNYKEVTGSDWYYEAVFDYSQPDLNLYNEEVQKEIMDIADFWIEMGVDGFRMDAAMHYDDADAGFNISFLNELYNHCREKDSDFYMVSEVWSDIHTIADYYGSGTPSFFNFDVADAEGKLIKAGRGNLTAEKFVLACEEYQTILGESNPDYIDAPFITNHDMGRVANALMCDPVSLKMTAGMLLTMSGSPFVYYGEEIGMKSKGKKDENKRLHMNWSEANTEGICNDPVNADKDIVQDLPTADEQVGDENSLYSYYKEALAVRNAIPAIARGSIEVIDELTDGHIAVIKKTWNNETVYIAYNNGDEPADISVSSYISEEVSVVGLLEADSHNSDMKDGVLTLDRKSIAFLK